MKIRHINADTVQTPTTGYVQAAEASGYSRMLFVSGQTPQGLDGAVPEGFEAQCRLAWRNVEAQLGSGDCSSGRSPQLRAGGGRRSGFVAALAAVVGRLLKGRFDVDDERAELALPAPPTPPPRW